MNKNLKNVTEIRCNVISKNGYPIYDLMVPSYPSDGHGDRLTGYVSATYTVFYTEDESILKQYNELRGKSDNFQQELDFLSKYPDCFMKDNEVPKMESNVQLAYSHLSSTKSIQETLKKKYFGCAFLIENDSLLIFHQNSLPIYNKDQDLTDKHEFKQASLKLLELYETGKAVPEGRITDGAFRQIKGLLKDYVVVPSLEKNHELKEEIQIVIAFVNNFQIKMDVDYSDVKQAHLTLKTSVHEKEYVLEKSEHKNHIMVDGHEMTMQACLKKFYLDSKVLDEKIDSFLGNKKYKIK